MPVYPQQYNYSPKTPSPMDYDLASEKQRIAEGTEEIKKELLEKWQKRYANAQIFPASLVLMNPELIKFLLSFQNTLFYNDLAKKFNLNQQQRDSLPKIVWYICLNKKWEQLKVSIINDLSVNSATADQIVSALGQSIITKARELATQIFTPQSTAPAYPKESAAGRIESWTINDAMKAYPEIGEQLITSEKIQLKNFPEPVRPSIKNWLADYTFKLGFNEHTSIERGNYMFHEKNTERLSSSDRSKLSFILKAYDENTTVTVNKDLKQIIFEKQESIPQATPVEKMHINPRNSSSMHNSVSFSSAQKLPYEKITNPETEQKAFASRVKFPPYQQPRPTNNIVKLEPKPEPPRTLPKNVVNLRDE